MKGRGFAGVLKRWGFHGTDASHGGHKYYRHGGSNGSNTFPGKVLKNKGMPGQMGNCPRTIQNLKVVEVNEKENLLFVKGSVPGMTDKYVMIRSAKKFKDPGERAWVNA
jgi:large subunit ribosomal protein L3